VDKNPSGRRLREKGFLLKGNLMMKLVDVHCHLLPRVDDGPNTVEEAGKMLAAMYEEGVRIVIATPHYRPHIFEAPMERIEKYYRILKKAAEAKGMRLYLGCEFYRHTELLESIKEGNRPLMAGADYVLVEFAPDDNFLTIRNYVYELVTNGYNPIIAHVERYEYCRLPELVQELRELGAYIQVNAGAVLGRDGRKRKKFVKHLMDKDLVDFIASDAHDRKKRKPNLGKCSAYLERKYGREYVHRILVRNPLNIIKAGDSYEKGKD
jgi:protein-tyrosine phosphatase